MSSSISLYSNNPSEQFYQPATLTDLLRWRALHSDKVGYTFLVDGETQEVSLTYGELDRRARAIAAQLQKSTVRGDRALLLYPPGLDYVAAFFGCLYAGLIAVPAYPPDPSRFSRSLPRLQTIVADSRTSVTLTTDAIRARASLLFDESPLLQSLNWMSFDEPEHGLEDEWRETSGKSSDLAFLQYTSGSTGAPKGVMLSHENLLHNASLVYHGVEHTAADKYVSWLPTFHDMGFMAGILQPLYAGIPVVSMSPVAFLQRPLLWLQAISRYQATTSGGPNFAYDLCVRKVTPEQRAELDLSRWSVAFNGAEPIRDDTLGRFAETFASCGFRREAFYPCYGLAEATLIVTGSEKAKPPVVKVVDAQSLENNLAIDAPTADEGRSLVGCGHVLLDQEIAIVHPEKLSRCTDGQIGEIWVSGLSVAQGYWDKPEESEQTFHAYVLNTGEGPFLRTGDLGFVNDGELYVTGRLKDLIIIRGLNHYPQDIELSVERSHPSLRAGCGAAFAIEVEDEERLVIVQEIDYRKEPDVNVVIDGIRAAVAAEHELQVYAVALIKAGRIPKTTSGKIQRRASRAAFLARKLELVAEWRVDAVAADAPPAGAPAERKQTAGNVIAWLILQMAARPGVVLQDLDVNQPIARYGLDSLAAIELMHKIETDLGVLLPMTSFLQSYSITELATLISERQATSSEPPSSRVQPEELTTEYPLSYGQRALWFLHQLAPESPVYNISAAVRIEAELNVAQFRRAFEKIVERHPALRTTFFVVDGEPVQRVHEDRALDFHEDNAAEWSEASLRERLVRDANRPFDLEHGPLLRVHLYRRSSAEYVLLLVVHHIVADFWSLAIVLRELGESYTSEQSGKQIVPASPSSSYGDYVRSQMQTLAGNEGEQLWNYWQKQLADVPYTLNLPTDRQRPPVQTYRGSSFPFKLNGELTTKIRELARNHGATLYMTLLASFQVVLHRYTNQDQFLIGSPTAGRGRAGLADVVGYFVNPVALAADFSQDPTFAEHLGRVRDDVFEAFAHQDFPFPLLVERLQPERDPSRSPLFQAVFALQKTHTLGGENLSPFALGEAGARIDLGALPLETLALDERVAQFDLMLMMSEEKDALAASLQYNADLFDQQTIERMATHFQTLLETIVSNPSLPVSTLPILPAPELQQMLVEWNDTSSDYPADTCVHSLFEAQTGQTPEAVAVACANESLTYRELNARANQLARYLRRAGVGPEVTAGILMDRSIAMVVGLLGVLKAGGAYLPLDPANTHERLAFMLRDSGAPVLLTQQSLAQQFTQKDEIKVFCIDTGWQEIADEDDTNLESGVTAAELAYVIYTSGSTGQPKGVEIPHAGLTNLIAWHQRAYGVTSGDRATQLAGPAFDASVWELWPYLTAGASIHIPDEETRVSPGILLQWLAANAITICFLPTPLAEAVIQETLPPSLTLRAILTGGDVLHRRVPAALPFMLVNHYGPTENTVVTTRALVTPETDTETLPPIGSPIANTQCFLLNKHLQPVPVGVPGELFIAGVGLARGYHDRPELTAEKFLPNPFSQQPGGRLYRTGDLARYLADGQIEFLGRLDYQVKVRGFRIELGEIESVLRTHPDVRDTVVVSWNDATENTRLAAYVVPSSVQWSTSAQLQSFLREKLPEYMVPAAFLFLTELPLTANGKIDRRALPAPAEFVSQSAVVSTLPRTPVEELLAGIWCQTLGVEQVGTNDNFFELGGHSLLATQVISRIRQTLKVDVSLQSMFVAPTLGALAEQVEEALNLEHRAGLPSIAPVLRDHDLPLSFAQQRLWFLDQLEPGNSLYNIPAALSLKGRLNAAALEQSLNEIVRRHESLRTVFKVVKGEPTQVIAAPQQLTLPVLDLRELPASERVKQAKAQMIEEMRRPFDLTAGPLMRVALLQVHDDEYVLLLTMHHIISDGWSLGLLLRELTTLYAAYAAGEPSPLPELPIQYADFAQWQREWLSGETLNEQLQYWRKQLAGAPLLPQLPTDRVRPAVQTFRGARVHQEWDTELHAQLKRLSQQEGVTLFMTLLAAFQLLLARWSGQEEAVVGAPIAGRTHLETESLIGFFVNTLVLRGSVSGKPSVRELLQRVREVCLEAYAHQDVPFEKLVEELQPERNLSHSPIFQVMFAQQDLSLQSLSLDDVEIGVVESDASTSKFDLTLFVSESKQGLIGTIEYNTDLFDESTIRRLLQHYTHLLDALSSGSSEQPLSALSMLSASEQQQILHDWNQTGSEYPQDRLLHHWFESQVERTPEATALVCGEQQLTYAELNARANQLGHRLRALGVTAETRVGVMLERTPLLLPSLLGVLKAGGAYVPLDPNYPQQRVSFMLDDAEVQVLLTTSELAPAGVEVPVICLDQEEQQGSSENPACVVHPENLSYVIYTSGSTGTPKGVAITHRNASAFIHWAINFFSPEKLQSVLASTSINFDLSVFELFAPLSAGGCVILADNALHLTTLPAASRVELINTVPSALAELVRQRAIPTTVRVINLAGEALSRKLVQEIYALGTVEQVTNLYGPSEDTTYSTYEIVADAADAAVLIGRPVSNTQVYLLDAEMQPVAVGVAGELYISGHGLARGYLKRPALTAERFIPNPFNQEPGARLYRTGDLARYRDDGRIEYLGRMDQQVKVRGFRIELGEIEALLERHSLVRQCVVTANDYAAGDKRLVAYVVTQAGETVTSSELRAFLEEQLPGHMIPSAFMQLAELPLTANGKVDRKRLPAAELNRDELAAEFVAARTPAEEVVAGIWAEVLKLERVGVSDNFFELGGHSLLATQVISRLREAFQTEVTLRSLFEDPTVMALAARIENSLREQSEVRHPALQPIARDGNLELSFTQQRLWFLDQLEPGSAFYNIAAAVQLDGELNIAALKQSFAEVVRRHEALRTRFVSTDGAPSQIIEEHLPFTLRETDLSRLAQADRDTEVRRLAAEEAQQGFDLAHGPLLRAGLLKSSDTEHVLLVTMHHIVSDGWSIGVLIQELAALYSAFSKGQPSPLPELPIQYVDFAHWQRRWLSGSTLQTQIDYWLDRLADAPTMLELPTDRPRPAVQSFRGAARSFKLPATLSESLKTFSRSEGVTLFTTLMATLQTLFHRYTGQHDFMIGSPIANRNHLETEKLIGCFTNTLVLRADLSGNPSFRGLLRRVWETILGAHAHQDVPFERLVEELQPQRDLSRSPLFQVMFVLQNAATAGGLDLPGLDIHVLETDSGTARFDLTLSMSETSDGLAGTLEFNTDLFDVSTIERLVTHYTHLLKAITGGGADHSLSTLPLLDSAECQQILEDWNATACDYPTTRLIHQWFETQVAHTPDSVAVVSAGEQLSYRELNTRANQLAHHLISRRVGPETRVGIMLERTPLMLVSLLATLKSGGAYVPLDPNYPQQRIAFMLEDAEIQVLLTDSQLSERLPENGAAIVCLDREWPNIATAAEENPTTTANPENLAYVIYTSGSTGIPKGVAITHRNASAFLHWSNEFFSAEKLRRVLASTSINFDLSVFELFAPLSCGGCVVLADNALQVPALSPTSQIELINTVPSAMAELVRQGTVPQSVRTVSLAGEALSRKLVQDIYAVGTVEHVINLYGPSEDTTYTTYEIVSNAEDEPVLIGRPIQNTQLYVLDREMQPVPIGVAGELYTAGDGLARGYLKRPALTAERFIPNPFSAEPGRRLYCTGDLARFRSDGRIEYLGRMDQQVKIRGFRIELGEIEAVLERHPNVRHSVVTARENEAGDKRLVAYLVAMDEQISSGELRAFLKDKLPDYMAPSAFVILAEMPLTPNGKVDRKRLPAPEQTRLDTETAYVAPRTQTEQTLTKIWSEVLRVERVGVEDNFFELGGHSLLATQVISRVRAAFQIDVPLRSLFEVPTCAALAAHIETAVEAKAALSLPPLQRRGTSTAAELSFTQQRLWFLDQLAPGSAFYNIGAAVRIEGELNANALEASFRELVRRHEALRTRFVVAGVSPIQVVDPSAELVLPITDLITIQENEREAEFQRLATEEARRPFDLTRGPLLRPRLFRLLQREHVLLVTMHHIISDGWSIRVLMHEIALLLEAFSQSKPSPLPELPIQFADFAQWQRECLQGELLETQLAYWKQQLSGAPLLLELPVDNPRTAVQTYAGARQSMLLPAALSEEIKTLSKTEGHTLFVILLAAFKALLSRYTNQTDIVIGSPVAGRNHIETESLIGFFANTLVLRTDMSDDPTFVELARRVREVVLEAQAHQDMPFEKLVEELQVARDLSRSPLFQVMFILQNAVKEELAVSGLTLTPMEIDSGTSKFDLTLFFEETKDGLRGTLEYNTDLFEAATISRLLRHFEILLESIVADSSRRLTEMPLLNDGERQQLLVERNKTRTSYNDAVCLHQLFEAQVERTPEAIALIFGEQQLTYAELNARANHLSHRLRALGVTAETRVGVMLERTPLLLTALLAVLKAGGAYVPLDPHYPQQRVSFMLSDAEVQVLLTTSELAPAGDEVAVLCLDREEIRTTSENPVCVVHPENLSYVIYTSGSTGTPKGVQILHQAVVNFLSFMQRQLRVTEQDVLLSVTSLSFDIAVLELFMPLITGAQVVLLTREQTMDAAILNEQLTRTCASLMQATPATWRMLTEFGWKAQPPLKVLCGGEALSRELAHQLADGGSELWNLYGPTETTVWSLTTRIESGAKRITIGRPMANTQVYVLDKQVRPVPINVPGELYIGGDGLARGYLKRSDLTAERFVPDPFSTSPGKRLYRTGDLVRYLANGEIEYLGRMDQQVKVRGFRIELGEIEALLERHSLVRQCVVTANEDAAGDKRLVAYMVTQAGQTVTSSELRAFLKEQLPEYMVPSAFIRLAELPLTANGKVDRKRLPAAELNRDELAAEFVAARTPTEEVVAGIWAQVLKLERVGVLDNFFELGGHSLLATQVMFALRDAFHVELPLRSIFESPTVSDLSHLIETAKTNGNGAITRLSRERFRVKTPVKQLVTLPEPLRNSADV